MTSAARATDSPARSAAAGPGTRTGGATGGARAGWRSMARAISWHRRLVAAAFVAVAVTAGIQVLRPAPVATRPVVVAAVGLPAGRILVPADLRVLDVPPDTAPAAAVQDATGLVGRRTAGPVGAGEPVTRTRLLGAELLAGYADLVGPDAVQATVRIADDAGLALIAPGDLVDVVAVRTDADGVPGAARVVADSVPVLAVGPLAGGAGSAGDPGGDATGDRGDGSGIVVLATTRPVALDLAGATVGAAVSLVQHPAR